MMELSLGFLGIIIVAWFCGRILILGRYMMKYLEVKCQDLCNFQMAQQN